MSWEIAYCSFFAAPSILWLANQFIFGNRVHWLLFWPIATVTCYIILLLGVNILDSQLEAELYKHDLNGDRTFSGVEEIEKAREILRGAGLRSTPARISVLNALRQGSKPQTHAELSDRLVPLGFDKATVFRNLTDLTDAELVSRTELGDHVWRFEMRDPSHDRSSHPHFVCVDCGIVSCMDGISLPDANTMKTLNISRISEILVKGHCLTCET